jgi:hypothetical protein
MLFLELVYLGLRKNPVNHLINLTESKDDDEEEQQPKQPAMYNAMNVQCIAGLGRIKATCFRMAFLTDMKLNFLSIQLINTSVKHNALMKD